MTNEEILEIRMNDLEVCLHNEKQGIRKCWEKMPPGNYFMVTAKAWANFTDTEIDNEAMVEYIHFDRIMYWQKI